MRTRKFERELAEAERQINHIEETWRQRPSSQSWLWRTVTGDERPEYHAKAVAERNRLAQKRATPTVLAALNLIQSYVDDWAAVEKLKPAFLKLQRELVAIRRERARAKAAALDGKTRDHAQAMAHTIPKTDDCPYCGGPLGNEPHLDHIHPVSKGGVSTRDNLLWACAPCNLRKRTWGRLSFSCSAGWMCSPSSRACG